MFLSHCRKLCTSLFSRSQRPRPAESRFRPHVEGLENRNLLSASFSNGVISVYGGNGWDTVTAQFDDNGTPSNALDDRVIVVREFSSVLPDQSVNVAKWKFNGSFWVPNVTEIVFYGQNGTNLFDNDTNIKSTASGGNGYDVFDGGSGSDYFYGGDGWDDLRGNGGNDYLYGQGGVDYLSGGDGSDYLNGGADGISDALNGGSGNDTFEAEWYWQYSGEFAVRKNRDHPQDLSSGDQVVPAPFPWS